MRDGDIRIALIEKLRPGLEIGGEAVVLHELGVSHGQAIIDVAVISDETHGFEIKSDKDTLARLPSQSRIYPRQFGRLTAVVAERHMAAVVETVPSWWGIVKATESRGKVVLRQNRKGRVNPEFDSRQVLQLLWRDELLEILESIHFDHGLRGKNRASLIERLSDNFSSKTLHWLVRHTLLKRTNWKPNKVTFGMSPGVDLGSGLLNQLLARRMGFPVRGSTLEFDLRDRAPERSGRNNSGVRNFI